MSRLTPGSSDDFGCVLKDGVSFGSETRDASVQTAGAATAYRQKLPRHLDPVDSTPKDPMTGTIIIQPTTRWPKPWEG